MPRRAKPYLKDNYWRTSVGGVQHHPLCSAEKSRHEAELALASYILKLDADGRNGETTTPPGPGIAARYFGPNHLPSSATVADAFDDFLSFKKTENAPDTFEWYRDKLDPLFERFHDRPICSLTLEDGLAYKDWLRNEKPWTKGKKEMKGLGNTSVNNHLRAAKTLLGWANKPSRRKRYGLSAENVWAEIGYLTEKSRERLITDDEMKALLDQCQDGNVAGGAQDFREMLIVLRYTTMRPGELRLLDWQYIDWNEHRVVFPPHVIKTRNRRETTLIELAENALLERKHRIEQTGAKATGFVFPTPGKNADGKRAAVPGGEHQKAGSLSQRFRRLFLRCVELDLIEKEKAGERIVLYSTRHNRITEMFRDGHSHSTVMFDAGHVVPQTTEKYKHLAGSHVAATIRSASPRGAANEPKKDGIAWNLNYLEKTWGIKLKSGVVNEERGPHRITLTLEFTKDVDNTGELKRAFSPQKGMMPTVSYYLFDSDNVVLAKLFVECLQGELTGKKGDAFRTVLNGFTNDVKKTVKKVEARPTPIEKK